MKLRWWLEDVWHGLTGSTDAKLVGGMVAVALLATGGYFAAQEVSKAHGGVQASDSRLVRLVKTVRYPVKVRVHGRTLTRWRVRREVVTARAHTVMRTQTLHTAGGTRVVTHPVVRYRVGKKQVDTVRSTVRSTATVTNSRTNTVVDSRTQTVVQTVERPVTVMQTVVETVTQPGTTVTVTLPGTTVTLPAP